MLGRNVGGVETGTCQSCGQGDCDDLVTLQRLYLRAGRGDGEAEVLRTDDIERWCAACRTHYPHQLIGEAGPPP